MEETEYTHRLRLAMEASADPVFSTEYIDMCCGYASKLLERNLPVLFDSAHVRKVLRMGGVSQEYHSFFVPKSQGKREIMAPGRPLKARQQWIYKNILGKQPVSPYAHGFIKERSIVSNAAQHAGQQYALCMDISDFFPSIKDKQVVSVFQDMGYSRSASEELARLCCHDGALPQGAPTSPCISNIVCRSMDEELSSLAEARHCAFTRYADDITFSADQKLDCLVPQVEKVLRRNGFSANREKCRLYGPGQPKHITGLVVQEHVHIPKQYKRALRKEIYYCQKYGVTAHLKNVRAEKEIHYMEHLYGKAYYIKMVEPQLGQRFLEELSKIDWPE